MQSVDQNGVLGQVMPFTQENLENELKKREVDHVHVFRGTPENIAKRESLVGKKLNLGVKRRYTKAPKSKSIKSNSKK